MTNKIFEKLIRHLRRRFGTVLLRAGNMKEDMKPWENRQYMIGVAADQSPSNPQNSYWQYFLNRPAGFIKKPWEKARELNEPIVYLKIYRPRRGYYHFELTLLEMQPALLSEAELAIKYKKLLEADINRMPDNYLWSHRRWKLPWKEAYNHLWIDEKPLPGTTLAES